VDIIAGPELREIYHSGLHSYRFLRKQAAIIAAKLPGSIRRPRPGRG
jgi:hypothetical protein